MAVSTPARDSFPIVLTETGNRTSFSAVNRIKIFLPLWVGGDEGFAVRRNQTSHDALRRHRARVAAIKIINVHAPVMRGFSAAKEDSLAIGKPSHYSAERLNTRNLQALRLACAGRQKHK